MPASPNLLVQLRYLYKLTFWRFPEDVYKILRYKIGKEQNIFKKKNLKHKKNSPPRYALQ